MRLEIHTRDEALLHVVERLRQSTVEKKSQFRELQAALPAGRTDFLQWPCPEYIFATRLGLIRAYFAHIVRAEKLDLAPQLPRWPHLGF